MINSDVPCTESIKHWVSWWSCPSSERTFRILRERKDDLFSPENKSCHYSWGVLEKASPCLKQILCKWSCSALRPPQFPVPAPQQLHPQQRRNREPSGTHGNWEQDVPVWTVLLDYGSFLAQVRVPVEKGRLLWVTHTWETRPAASLTRISDPAGRELRVHLQGSARHTAGLPVFVTVWEARLIHHLLLPLEGVLSIWPESLTPTRVTGQKEKINCSEMVYNTSPWKGVFAVP